uniref:Uncharacterized protein n=1 Tax=Strigamia maritima TaxID=126957 RepID=T1IR10_STRMM
MFTSKNVKSKEKEFKRNLGCPRLKLRKCSQDEKDQKIMMPSLFHYTQQKKRDFLFVHQHEENVILKNKKLEERIPLHNWLNMLIIYCIRIAMANEEIKIYRIMFQETKEDTARNKRARNRIARHDASEKRQELETIPEKGVYIAMWKNLLPKNSSPNEIEKLKQDINSLASNLEMETYFTRPNAFLDAESVLAYHYRYFTAYYYAIYDVWFSFFEESKVNGLWEKTDFSPKSSPVESSSDSNTDVCLPEISTPTKNVMRPWTLESSPIDGELIHVELISPEALPVDESSFIDVDHITPDASSPEPSFIDVGVEQNTESTISSEEYERNWFEYMFSGKNYNNTEQVDEHGPAMEANFSNRYFHAQYIYKLAEKIFDELYVHNLSNTGTFIIEPKQPTPDNTMLTTVITNCTSDVKHAIKVLEEVVTNLSVNTLVVFIESNDNHMNSMSDIGQRSNLVKLIEFNDRKVSVPSEELEAMDSFKLEFDPSIRQLVRHNNWYVTTTTRKGKEGIQKRSKKESVVGSICPRADNVALQPHRLSRTSSPVRS